MDLPTIIGLLNAENLTNQLDMSANIHTVHASDLISEVLASCGRGALWLTSLLDTQIVNTAELFDLSCVVFVGSRRPSQEIIDAALEDEIPIFVTKLSMFEACGVLYQHGLKTANRH
ncbi:MAG TPA: transcriptional regulator [bacterium]|nr:transcriptional regulator [bacterium]